MQILSLKDFEVLPKVYYHTMVSDSKFYASFFDKIIDLVDNPGEANGEDAAVEMTDAANVGEAPHRMKYLLHQLDIIPKGCRRFYKNLMRANPTSPLYLFLIIGVLGTNMARYSAVRRPSGHVSNVTFWHPTSHHKRVRGVFVDSKGGDH